MLRPSLPPTLSFYLAFPGELESFEPGESERPIAGAIAHATRRSEFLLGRLAARRALAGIGVQAEPAGVGRDELGAPIWPAGTIGSITHTHDGKGTAGAALVAMSSAVRAVGIDIEAAGRTTSTGISDKIAFKEELDALGNTEAPLLRLFSAKESVYKALAPLCKRRFWFHDVKLLWRAERGVFEGELLTDLHASLCKGLRFDVNLYEDERHILTALVLSGSSYR